MAGKFESCTGSGVCQLTWLITRALWKRSNEGECTGLQVAPWKDLFAQHLNGDANLCAFGSAKEEVPPNICPLPGCCTGYEGWQVCRILDPSTACPKGAGPYGPIWTDLRRVIIWLYRFCCSSHNVRYFVREPPGDRLNFPIRKY